MDEDWGFLDPSTNINTALKNVLDTIGTDPEGIKAAGDAVKPIESRAEDIRIMQLQDLVPGGPPLGQKRITRLLMSFINAHKTVKEMLPYVGRERVHENLLIRFKLYILSAVKASVKKDRQGTVLLDPATGEEIYMSIGSLKSIVNGMIKLLRYVPQPPLSYGKRKIATESLWKYMGRLIIKYHLRRIRLKKMTLYPTDVKYMVEVAQRIYGTRYDIMVQIIALIVTFTFTGSRPGSLLSTQHWPDDYLQWKQLEFRPFRYDQGVILGYDVWITINSFKGYHQVKDPLSITFQVKTVKNERYQVLELGMWLIAHGLRRGVFGGRTLEDLRTTTAFSFKADPQYLDKPVFVSLHSRTQLGDRPMSDRKANGFLKVLLGEMGIITGNKYTETIYALRRGFATQVSRHLSRRLARWFLGHKANSTMLEEEYDQSAVEENMTGGVLGPETEHEAVSTPLSLTRLECPVAVPDRVSLREALSNTPEYRHTSAKRAFLRQCLKSGSTVWMRTAPYSTMQGGNIWSQAHLPLFIAKYTSQLETLTRQMQRNEYKDQLQIARMAQDELDYRIVKARREALEKPSDLALDLQRRMVEQEAVLLQSVRTEAGKEEKTVVEVPEFDDKEEAEENEDYDDDEEDEETEEQEGTHVMEDGGDDNDDAFAAGDDLDEYDQQLSDNEEPEADEDIHLGDERSAESADKAEVMGEGGSDREDAEDCPDPSEEDLGEGVLGIGETSSDIKLDKMDMLSHLVKLIDTKDGGHCELCLKDSTATQQNKAKVWVEGVKKSQHILSFHSEYHRANRWMKSFVRDKWYCPIETCTYSMHASTTNSSWMKRAIPHLDTHHRAQLPSEFVRALNPKTRAITRAEITANIEQQLNVVDQRVYGQSLEELLLPGVGRLQDWNSWLGECGLGPSIIDSEYIDYGEDAIPDGLLDGEGNLILE